MKKYIFLLLCCTQFMTFTNDGDKIADFLCKKEIEFEQLISTESNNNSINQFISNDESTNEPIASTTTTTTNTYRPPVIEFALSAILALGIFFDYL